jgi:hypothetical protein
MTISQSRVVMRRICLIGAAVAGSLVFSVTIAAAAKTAKVKPTAVKCKIAMSVATPDGSIQVALPADSGVMFGTASCGKVLGSGIADYNFALQDTGDLTGSFKVYFSTGSVHGKFDLSPTDSSPSSPNTFLSQDYTGTAKVTGGTGTDAGVTGKATLVCSTPDSIHMSCTEKAKVKF